MGRALSPVPHSPENDGGTCNLCRCRRLPVKDEILKVAERHGLPVTLVSNGGLRPSRDPIVRHVVVSKGADAADDWIAENVKPNDIVVTADIPLASRTVAAGAHVLG